MPDLFVIVAELPKESGCSSDARIFILLSFFDNTDTNTQLLLGLSIITAASSRLLLAWLSTYSPPSQRSVSFEKPAPQTMRSSA